MLLSVMYVTWILLFPILLVCMCVTTAHDLLRMTEDISHTVQRNTSLGPVVGWSIHPGDEYSVTRLEVFLGIPYAESPVGQLRFSRPVRKTPWAPLTWNATGFSPICPQDLSFVHRYSFPPSFNNTAEDCLHLNVYSPKVQTSSDPLPVMVWIHGGSYRYGAGQEYDGRLLALEGVVVVTFNFRLGVLGYLSTDDDVAAGNYGLLDQVMALEWVRDNIGYFRGDPSRVTIFGESSGGGSVSLHGFSKLSKGLFHALIPQSGCALSPWAIYRPPHAVSDVTRQLAIQLNCSVLTSQSVIDCLRGISADQLVNAQVEGPPMIAAWAPRVDGYFIDKLPDVLLTNGEFQTLPMLTGTVRDESADEAEFIPEVSQGFNRTFLDELFYTWSTRFLNKTDVVYEAVNCEYLDNNISLVHNRELFIEMKSDYGYIAPHQRLAERYSAVEPPVWMYSFQFRSRNDPSPKWLGVYHGTELYYLFGTPFAKELPCPWDSINIQPDYANWTAQDRNISKIMMRIWTNFAKTRNPNPIPGLTENLTRFDMHQKKYLFVDDVLSVKENLKPGRMEFWNNKLPKLLRGKITAETVCNSSSSGLEMFAIYVNALHTLVGLMLSLYL